MTAVETGPASFNFSAPFLGAVGPSRPLAPEGADFYERKRSQVYDCK